jgi:phosphoglucosamine mutase
MIRRYFGTDGVRGPFGGPLINPEFASRLAQAAARWLGTHPFPKVVAGAPTVLIGRDTRYSGLALKAGVVAGFEAEGFHVGSLGILPTPAVSMAVRAQGASLGVVITASHNPASDNGIKFFGPEGTKLTDEQEAAIESFMSDTPPQATHRRAHPLDITGAYVATSMRLLPANALAGWCVVLDTANGATSTTTPVALRGLGAELVSIGAAPDGHNINDGVGSEHPKRLCALVVESGARLGIAHDGDGDRCIFCDETGSILDGDEVLTILALHAQRKGRLAKNTLVLTQQSNLGVDHALGAAGIRVCRTPIGDRYVMERMRLEGASLGGESSGHVICSDVAPTGDGLVAALRVLEAMIETGQPLSGLRRSLSLFPQRTKALKVAEKRPLDALPGLGSTMAALEAELGDRGRLLVRYSGTESKLRLLVEGPAEATVRAGLERLERAARSELQVLE